MTLLRKSALALILAVLAIPAHPEEPAKPNGVSVTGTAVMSVSPDIISWSIQVKDTNPNLMTAKTSNDNRLRDVMQLVRELGIPTEDVSTQFVHRALVGDVGIRRPAVGARPCFGLCLRRRRTARGAR